MTSFLMKFTDNSGSRDFLLCFSPLMSKSACLVDPQSLVLFVGMGLSSWDSITSFVKLSFHACVKDGAGGKSLREILKEISLRISLKEILARGKQRKVTLSR